MRVPVLVLLASSQDASGKVPYATKVCGCSRVSSELCPVSSHHDAGREIFLSTARENSLPSTAKDSDFFYLTGIKVIPFPLPQITWFELYIGYSSTDIGLAHRMPSKVNSILLTNMRSENTGR